MKPYLLLLCLLPIPAFAYFDIGTGTYLFQVLAASFLGFVYTVRHHVRVALSKLMFWKKPISTPPQDEKSNENNP